MKLNDLVNRIPHTGASDTDITAITYDSRFNVHARASLQKGSAHSSARKSVSIVPVQTQLTAQPPCLYFIILWPYYKSYFAFGRETAF